MPSERARNFVFDEGHGEIINDLSTGPGNYSRAINAIIGRYNFIVTSSIPDLVAHEWKILIEVLPTTTDPWTIGMIEHPIKAALNNSGEARKAQIDCGQFAAKLTRLTLSEKMAIVNAIDLYRAAQARGEKPELPGGTR